MDKKLVSSRQYFKTLAIIHFALIAGQLVFLAVSFSIADDAAEQDESQFWLLVPMVVAGGILIGGFLRKKIVEKGKRKNLLHEKLASYQVATIIHSALCEGPSLFAIVAYLITAKSTFLIYTAICIAATVFNRPSRADAIKHLDLSTGEEASINDPDALIAASDTRYNNYS